MDYHWYDFLGNVGVFTILWCYLSLQLGRMSSEDLLFSIFNGIGATLIIVSLFFEFNLSAFLIEIFWLLISLIGVFKGLGWLPHRSDSIDSADRGTRA
jgi:hypothetical protein